jgi:(E)-4-hydroxy-3-methylbut-2-enyl-diphosphate synthase
LVNQVDEALRGCEKPITVAVMGCVVNGPGEAREADIGIAGGDGWGMIFEKGVQVDKLPYDQLLDALLKRIDEM